MDDIFCLVEIRQSNTHTQNYLTRSVIVIWITSIIYMSFVYINLLGNTTCHIQNQ